MVVSGYFKAVELGSLSSLTQPTLTAQYSQTQVHAHLISR
jgi:hypothetical protein